MKIRFIILYTHALLIMPISITAAGKSRIESAKEAKVLASKADEWVESALEGLNQFDTLVLINIVYFAIHKFEAGIKALKLFVDFEKKEKFDRLKEEIKKSIDDQDYIMKIYHDLRWKMFGEISPLWSRQITPLKNGRMEITEMLPTPQDLLKQKPYNPDKL